MTAPQQPPYAASRLLRGVPTALALAVMGLGVVNVISGLTPERAGRFPLAAGESGHRERPHQRGLGLGTELLRELQGALVHSVIRSDA